MTTTATEARTLTRAEVLLAAAEIATEAAALVVTHDTGEKLVPYRTIRLALEELGLEERADELDYEAITFWAWRLLERPMRDRMIAYAKATLALRREHRLRLSQRAADAQRRLDGAGCALGEQR